MNPSNPTPKDQQVTAAPAAAPAQATSQVDPASLKKAIQWAAQNPDAPQARELQARITAGNFNDSIRAMGLSPEQFGYKAPAAPEQKPLAPGNGQDSAFGNTPEAAAAREATQVHVVPVISDYLSRVKDSVVSAAKTAASNGGDGQSLESPARALLDGLHKAAAITGAAISPVTEAISPALKPVMDKIGDAASSNPAIREALDYANGIIDKHPDLATGIGDLFNTFMNTAALVGGPKVAPTVIREAAATATDAADITARAAGATADRILGNKTAVPAAPPALNEARVAETYNKAIRPSVSNKGNAAQAAQADANAVSGVKAIAENKGNLSLTDAEGNVVKGEYPKTVDQLSQAIEQTKRGIFDKYDALAKEAGQSGMTVDTAPAASELRSVADSKALQIANPDSVAYAKSVADRLEKSGPIDAKTAQDVVQHLNASLKAFYRNPSYDTASRAAVDALVANKLRESLDRGITEATGEQYGALKRQYGALSSIEKDVARRAASVAKSAPQGLVSTLSNISSGVELVNGLMHLSPAHLAASGVIKGIQMYAKYLNNPDVGVAKIFSQIEKSTAAPAAGAAAAGKPAPFEPRSAAGRAAKSVAETPNKQGGFVRIGSSVDDRIAAGIDQLLAKSEGDLKNLDTTAYLQELRDKVSKKGSSLTPEERRLFNITAEGLGMPELKVSAK